MTLQGSGCRFHCQKHSNALVTKDLIQVTAAPAVRLYEKLQTAGILQNLPAFLPRLKILTMS